MGCPRSGRGRSAGSPAARCRPRASATCAARCSRGSPPTRARPPLHDREVARVPARELDLHVSTQSGCGRARASGGRTLPRRRSGSASYGTAGGEGGGGRTARRRGSTRPGRPSSARAPGRRPCPGSRRYLSAPDLQLHCPILRFPDASLTCAYACGHSAVPHGPLAGVCAAARGGGRSPAPLREA